MRIRKNTDISTELYEKEIKKLREENKKLLARCTNAEKYMNEYKELSKQSKKLIEEYKETCERAKSLEQEYENLLHELVKNSKEELKLKE